MRGRLTVKFVYLSLVLLSLETFNKQLISPVLALLVFYQRLCRARATIVDRLNSAAKKELFKN